MELYIIVYQINERAPPPNRSNVGLTVVEVIVFVHIFMLMTIPSPQIKRELDQSFCLFARVLLPFFLLSFLHSFLFLLWRLMRSYWPHLEVRYPISGDCRLIAFIRRTPHWGFPGFSSAVRQMPGDLCTVPILIIIDRRDWRDTRGKWPLARNPDRSWWPRHTSLKLFWPQPMAPWTAALSLFRN